MPSLERERAMCNPVTAHARPTSCTMLAVPTGSPARDAMAILAVAPSVAPGLTPALRVAMSTATHYGPRSLEVLFRVRSGTDARGAHTRVDALCTT
jgi:hypothetical protein